MVVSDGFEQQDQDNTPVLPKGADVTTSVDCVQAERVVIDRGTSRIVNAQTATLENSIAGRVNAEETQLDRSVVVVVQGTNIQAEQSCVGIASVTQATVNGPVGIMIGQSATFNNHRTGLVITNEVHGGPIQSVFFVAGKTSVPVETIVDQRSVALFGLAAGVALGLVISLFRLFKR
jgi:hypothetical protein